MYKEKWCKKPLKEIIKETIFYHERDNTNIIIFGGSTSEKILIYKAIKYENSGALVSLESKDYKRKKENDYTIDLNQIEISKVDQYFSSTIEKTSAFLPTTSFSFV